MTARVVEGILLCVILVGALATAGVLLLLSAMGALQ